MILDVQPLCLYLLPRSTVSQGKGADRRLCQDLAMLEFPVLTECRLSFCVLLAWFWNGIVSVGSPSLDSVTCPCSFSPGHLLALTTALFLLELKVTGSKTVTEPGEYVGMGVQRSLLLRPISLGAAACRPKGFSSLPHPGC